MSSFLFKISAKTASIGWEKPFLQDEVGEYFENTFTKQYFKKMGLSFKTDKELLAFLNTGKLVSITKEKLSKKYDNLTLSKNGFKKELADPEYRASYIKMEKSLAQGKLKLPAPIVILFGDTYYGFAGNRRMNLAFNNDIPLKVWLISTDKKPS